MRPTKFRGLTKDGEWVYGYCIKFGGLSYISQFEDSTTKLFVESFVEVIPETVGQSTGFKDKNGEEGWKDDLIKVVGEVFVVVWHFNRWVMKNVKTGRIKEFRQIDQCFYEVIGSIHTHPELLEQP